MINIQAGRKRQRPLLIAILAASLFVLVVWLNLRLFFASTSSLTADVDPFDDAASFAGCARVACESSSYLNCDILRGEESSDLCCSKHRFRLLQQVDVILKHLNIEHFVTKGTLLSVVRRVEALGDDDIDVAVHAHTLVSDEQLPRLRRALSANRLRLNIINEEVARICVTSAPSSSSSSSSSSSFIFADIYGVASQSTFSNGALSRFYSHYHRDNCRLRINSSVLFPVDYYADNVYGLPLPRNSTRLLRAFYGDDWKTPQTQTIPCKPTYTIVSNDN